MRQLALLKLALLIRQKLILTAVTHPNRTLYHAHQGVLLGVFSCKWLLPDSKNPQQQ